MNEQIQKLLNVCGMPNEDLMDIYSDTNKSFYMQKFAELIVKECMDQVWYTREDGINGNVSEVIKDRMKQHFGVEE